MNYPNYSTSDTLTTASSRTEDMTDRHPSTMHILQYFDYEHLAGPLRSTSRRCATLADEMVRHLPDGPELTTGLRKLLEAKDCFVRASIPPVEEETYG